MIYFMDAEFTNDLLVVAEQAIVYQGGYEGDYGGYANENQR